MEKICFITNKYPNPIEPNVLVFVQQLVWTIADTGIDCAVICPMPVNLNPKYARFPYKTTEVTENGFKVDIYFPKYVGFGQSYIFGYNPAKVTTNLFTRATEKVVQKMKKKPDVLYGHFTTPAGIAAARIGRSLNIPAFMAHGESTYRTVKHFGESKVPAELKTLNGVIAVSNRNKKMLTTNNIVNEEKISVFPNGYREERFYPRDKIKARNSYGLPQDKFIVCFVGSFDHRKGVKRLEKAINKSDNIYAVYAGQGSMKPEGEHCLYNKSVSNDQLPFFYSAADVFVLPTLDEGCCNAIIEAMACGLPIISSDRSFNDDILDETCSIRVDPENIDEIKEAIELLYNNEELRNTLSKGSLEMAKDLTLVSRAENIISYMERNISLEKQE